MRNEVYGMLKKVPKGRVTTYKELAKAVGTKAYRVIGRYMKTNPFAPDVPCHRVVRSDGTIGGFSGKSEGPQIERKKKMLIDEGILFDGEKVRDFNGKLHKF